ncbi:MAG: Mut7-C RNAse domain-containing protein, partial [Candidatus Thiodiazotropha sp. (ex Gloverina cf. vestifex)]|nr:Mut7-C RNAse domain-containing protein [Candidatus Thiodiazotropha sp. (ex Gloverina cf. vestifex)]
QSQLRPYNRAYAYRGLIASAFSLPWRSATEFWRCSDCAKIYWKGSHYRQLMEFIKTIAPAAFDE